MLGSTVDKEGSVSDTEDQKETLECAEEDADVQGNYINKLYIISAVHLFIHFISSEKGAEIGIEQGAAEKYVELEGIYIRVVYRFISSFIHSYH